MKLKNALDLLTESFSVLVVCKFRLFLITIHQIAEVKEFFAVSVLVFSIWLSPYFFFFYIVTALNMKGGFCNCLTVL